tara:strand:- start:2743 stop:3384 length:642 start_codon:yes stop_codon:yes gene_type:complete
MSTIFPGNYVAHLNAYREQGVEALPGIEFYRIVGALVLNPDNDSNLSGGSLSAATYNLKVLSPDMRQDDKPRLDKAFEIPANSVVYRTSISAPGVKANAAADTIKIKGLGGNAPGNTGSEITLTAGSDKFYPANGATSPMLSLLNGTPISTSAATAVQVITSAANTAEQNPSVGADRLSPSAILVEVCYYRPAAAPDIEDAHVPFATEAGSGT